MRNKNYYLKQIANNTGSNITGNKSDNYLLRQITRNTGSELDDKSRNNYFYLKQIALNTSL